MDSPPDLLEYYRRGCVVQAAEAWLALFREDPSILRREDERANIVYCAEECASLGLHELVARFWDLTATLFDLCEWDLYTRLDLLCLAAAEALGQLEMQADIYGELGFVSIEQGKNDQAEQYLLEGGRRYALLQDAMGLGRIARYSCILLLQKHEWEQARQDARALLAMFPDTQHSTPDRTMELNYQWTLEILGIALRELGDLDGADRAFGIAYRERRDPATRIGITSMLNIAKLRLRQGRGEDGRTLLAACLQECERERMPDLAAHVLLEQARLARQEQCSAEAADLARSAWQIYSRLGASLDEAAAAEFLSVLSR